MFKYLIIAIFLHLSLKANKVTCTAGFNNEIFNLLHSEDHDATSHAFIDTDDLLPTTSQSESLYSSSDSLLDTSSTTDLPSSTESIEYDSHNDKSHKSSDTIDWKILFVCFSMVILVLTMCKFCSKCIPNLCEMCLDEADTTRIQQPMRESTSTTTAAENRCKTCHERTPHQPWSYYANQSETVLELEPISGPVLPPNSTSTQVMSFPMDNEAFTDDDSDVAMTDRAQNCETPPPPYSASMSDADNDNRHEMETVE